jgi:hypothetical protein
MCAAHYNQQLRGNVPGPLRYSKDPREVMFRLQSHAATDEETGCWIWTGTRSRGSYGRTSHMGRDYYVHRLAYELTFGDIEPGAVIHHKCGVNACFNPDHLQAVTPVENAAESFERMSLIKRITELELRVADCVCGRAA